MNNIVVLVNERPESRAALDWALNAGTGLHSAGTEPTVHVVLGPSTDIPGGPRYVSPTLADDIASQLRASSVKHEIYSEPTHPAGRVIFLAGQVNADIVVIGLRKRSATLKLIIGSHQRDILVDAPCPVVGVKE
jgi:nucleotide-binding universal stress UspA family protein